MNFENCYMPPSVYCAPQATARGDTGGGNDCSATKSNETLPCIQGRILGQRITDDDTSLPRGTFGVRVNKEAVDKMAELCVPLLGPNDEAMRKITEWTPQHGDVSIDGVKDDWSEFDPVNRPEHYNSHPAGIEAIDVIRYATDYDLAQAMRYIWRVLFGTKDDTVQDISKARWYLTDWLREHGAE